MLSRETIMFWVVIAIVVALVIGASVLIGALLNRSRTGRRPSRREQASALKASGAFPHRKENQP
jgi:uncharacterized membrane-anchored protein YhcB (DUF1043 family)